MPKFILKTASCAALFVLFVSSAAAQNIKITTTEGDTMKVSLGYNIFLNTNSTAKRQVHRVTDEKSPVKLVGDHSFSIDYKSDRSSGSYVYQTRVSHLSEKDLVAIEVLHSVFDVFGRHVRTLQEVLVSDIQAGNTHNHSQSSWRIFSESEAATAHSTFTYVNQARFKDGTVYTAPTSAILAAIRKMSPTATEEQISPPKSKQ